MKVTSIIRPFKPEDYQAIADVYKAAVPKYPVSAEEMQHDDNHYRAAHCKCQRWVAEADGRIVGVGEYAQRADRFHPRKFGIEGYVHPLYQGKRIGAALYTQVITALQVFEPLYCLCSIEEDNQRSVRFLTDRGLQEVNRSWTSRLDITEFDLASYANVEDKLRTSGIEIKTYKELECDPERNRKLYELNWECRQDMPSVNAPTPIAFEQFVSSRLSGPDFVPDAYFIAVYNNQYVGCSDLCDGTIEGKIIRTGFTGVARVHRGKGIAMALKLRGIAYAQQKGFESVETTNSSVNRPMLAINERLDFAKQPAIITYKKIFSEEE